METLIVVRCNVANCFPNQTRTTTHRNLKSCWSLVLVGAQFATLHQALFYQRESQNAILPAAISALVVSVSQHTALPLYVHALPLPSPLTSLSLSRAANGVSDDLDINEALTCVHLAAAAYCNTTNIRTWSCLPCRQANVTGAKYCQLNRVSKAVREHTKTACVDVVDVPSSSTSFPPFFCQASACWRRFMPPAPTPTAMSVSTSAASALSSPSWVRQWRIG